MVENKKTGLYSSYSAFTLTVCIQIIPIMLVIETKDHPELLKKGRLCFSSLLLLKLASLH